MKKDQITRELNGMVGKKYRYRGEVHTVLRFTNENVVKIITDKKDITFMPEDFNPKDFELIPVVVQDILTTAEVKEENKYSNLPSRPNPQGLNTLISQQGFDIASVIKENINMVKKDPSYVPQAEAINNSVKVFIELAKVEVEMLKATR